MGEIPVYYKPSEVPNPAIGDYDLVDLGVRTPSGREQFSGEVDLLQTFNDLIRGADLNTEAGRKQTQENFDSALIYVGVTPSASLQLQFIKRVKSVRFGVTDDAPPVVEETDPEPTPEENI